MGEDFNVAIAIHQASERVAAALVEHSRSTQEGADAIGRLADALDLFARALEEIAKLQEIARLRQEAPK
jgi:cob(I)alamin adenosyltransferase